MRKQSSLFAVALVAALSLAGHARADGELAKVVAPDPRIQLGKLHGEVVMVTFASRATQREVARVNEQLATRARPGDAIVLTVIDFEGIPRMFYGYARRRAADHEQPGRIEHVLDERGQLRRPFHVDPVHRVDILVIDRDGNLRGRFVGEKQVNAALQLVDDLRRATM